MSRYTRWYRDGTISATAASTEITGSGTYWESAGLNPGDMLEVNNSGLFYEIASINSDTSITLARAYQGTTVTGAAYAVVRNFTATMPSRIAAQTSELITDFKKYVDSDMERITGKSAYEVAVDNGYVGTAAEWLETLKGKNAYQLAITKGYTGTEAEWLEALEGDSAYEIAVANGYTGTVTEWLESLKAAGEWSTLDERTEPLTYNNAPAHNAICRGKDLGTEITAEQIANIRNKSYKDIYCGDTWTLNLSTYGSTKAVVWGCDIYGGLILGLVNRNFKWRINDPDEEGNYSWEGHLKGSKIYNETLPALLAEVEAVIPPEYIMTRWDLIGDAVRIIQTPNGHPAYTYGLRSHSSSSNTERIYLASARNVGYDFSAVYDYNWNDTHIDNIQQNVGWLQINNVKFPFFNHKPLTKEEYAPFGVGFLGLSMFQIIKNYYIIDFGNNWTPVWLPFVILG